MCVLAVNRTLRHDSARARVVALSRPQRHRHQRREDGSDTWTEKDYNWRVELPGIGHSSPVLWGDRIFLTSAVEDTAERILLCLNAADGRILWQRRYASDVHEKHLRNSFATPSPACDEEHAYFAWSTPAEYTLVAHEPRRQGKMEAESRPLYRASTVPALRRSFTRIC